MPPKKIKASGSLKAALALRYDKYLHRERLQLSFETHAPQQATRHRERKARLPLRVKSKLPASDDELPTHWSDVCGTKQVFVYVEGSPGTAVMVEQDFKCINPQESWHQFLLKVAEALGIPGVELVRSEKSGADIWRLCSLFDGERYVIIPEASEMVLRAIVDSENVVLNYEKTGDMPRLPPLNESNVQSMAYEELRDSIAVASSKLHQAVKEAEKTGWIRSALESELASAKIEAFLNHDVSQLKARTQAEVRARNDLQRDIERAKNTVEGAMKFLEERKRKQEAYLAICSNPDREAVPYFAALDEIEATLRKKCTDVMPRKETRALFRRCIRWLANAALQPKTARIVVSHGACERIFKYIRQKGPLCDDVMALQYALCFYNNLAALGKDMSLCKLPLTAGGAALALSVMHEHCATLRAKTLDADRALSTNGSRVISSFYACEGQYAYALTNPQPSSKYHCSSSMLHAVKQCALCKRTNEYDVEPTEVEKTELHWWASSVALALLRGPFRKVALSILVDDYHMIAALLATVVGWSRYRHIVVITTWVLQELVKEAVLLNCLHSCGFVTWLQVAQTRHCDVTNIQNDIEIVMNALGARKGDRQCGDAVGRLEHALLDAPTSVYRSMALHKCHVDGYYCGVCSSGRFFDFPESHDATEVGDAPL